jgi:hypothetical protein
MEFVDGACKINNTSTTAGSYIFKELSTKPSTFTFSCTIRRTAGTVATGVAVCLNSTTGSAYRLLIGDQTISVIMPGQTSAPGINCPDCDPLLNKFTISKTADTFHVFVNDRFVTSFIDSLSGSGNIGIISYPGSTIYIDNVMLTDQFTRGAKPTCYADSFTNSSLTYWQKIINKATVTVSDGALNVEAENDSMAYVYMLTKLELTDFRVRVEVSHRGGNKNSLYGLRVNGTGTEDFASFIINANRMYGVGLGNSGITMTGSTIVKGAAYGTYFYIDTLEITKKSGSNEVVFTINNTAVDTLDNFKFAVNEVGFFCQDSVSLKFDNFSAGTSEGVICPVYVYSGRPVRGAARLITEKSPRVIDIMGRQVLSDPSGRVMHNDIRATGVYINRASDKTLFFTK